MGQAQHYLQLSQHIKGEWYIQKLFPFVKTVVTMEMCPFTFKKIPFIPPFPEFANFSINYFKQTKVYTADCDEGGIK